MYATRHTEQLDTQLRHQSEENYVFYGCIVAWFACNVLARFLLSQTWASFVNFSKDQSMVSHLRGTDDIYDGHSVSCSLWITKVMFDADHKTTAPIQRWSELTIYYEMSILHGFDESQKTANVTWDTRTLALSSVVSCLELLSPASPETSVERDNLPNIQCADTHFSRATVYKPYITLYRL